VEGSRESLKSSSSLSIPIAGGSRREQLKDLKESANLIEDELQEFRT
jgi:hypothetical protein